MKVNPPPRSPAPRAVNRVSAAGAQARTAALPPPPRPLRLWLFSSQVRTRTAETRCTCIRTVRPMCQKPPMFSTLLQKELKEVTSPCFPCHHSETGAMNMSLRFTCRHTIAAIYSLPRVALSVPCLPRRSVPRTSAGSFSAALEAHSLCAGGPRRLHGPGE